LASRELRNEQVMRLLKWAGKSTQSRVRVDSTKPMSSSDKTMQRVVAVFLILNLLREYEFACTLSLTESLTLALDLARARDLSFGTNSVRDVDRIRTLESAFSLAQSLDPEFNAYFNFDCDFKLKFDLDRDPSSDLDNVRGYFRDNILTGVDFNELLHRLEELYLDKPELETPRNEKAEFWKRWYRAWFHSFQIEPKEVTLAIGASKSLANYLYICELMVRCKDGAARISPEVWAGIESRILSVPVTTQRQ